jgi:hypothetical protein
VEAVLAVFANFVDLPSDETGATAVAILIIRKVSEGVGGRAAGTPYSTRRTGQLVGKNAK